MIVNDNYDERRLWEYKNPLTGLTSVYRPITTIEDVNEDVLTVALDVADRWMGEPVIDWDGFWEKFDGHVLPDGTHIDLGSETITPAIRKIQRHVAQHRRRA